MKTKAEQFRDFSNKWAEVPKKIEKIDEGRKEVTVNVSPIAITGKISVLFEIYNRDVEIKNLVKISEKEKRFIIEYIKRQYGITITSDMIEYPASSNGIKINFDLRMSDLNENQILFEKLLKIRFKAKVIVEI